MKKINGASPPPLQNINILPQETVSNVFAGMPSRPVVTSSVPDSAAGMDGRSMSFDSSNHAFRRSNEWNHAEGGGGGGRPSSSSSVSVSAEAPEAAEGSNMDSSSLRDSGISYVLEKARSMLFSSRDDDDDDDGGGNNSDDDDDENKNISSSNLSFDSEEWKNTTSEGKYDDIWSAAFQRARKMQYSE